MTRAADKTEELADILREENRHHAYWQKFYAIIGAVVLLGLVVLYFGFRKPARPQRPDARGSSARVVRSDERRVDARRSRA